MTLEASIIMGLCLCLFVFLISLSFYMYDRCLYAQDTYILCFRESYRKEEADLAAELRGLAGRQFGTKYFSLHGHHLDASAGSVGVNCSVKASVVPFAFQKAAPMPASEFSMQLYASARHTDPPLRMRRARRLSYVAGRALSLIQDNYEE